MNAQNITFKSNRFNTISMSDIKNLLPISLNVAILAENPRIAEKNNEEMVRWWKSFIVMEHEKLYIEHETISAHRRRDNRKPQGHIRPGPPYRQLSLQCFRYKDDDYLLIQGSERAVAGKGRTAARTLDNMANSTVYIKDLFCLFMRHLRCGRQNGGWHERGIL